MDYKQKLLSPKWQKKRLKIFERDKFTCQLCMDSESELVAHHKKYIQGKEIWDYPDEYLITLCKSCHEKFHEKIYEQPEIQIPKLRTDYKISKRWAEIG